MTSLWGKWKDLIQSGLTAPRQVVKVPSKGSCKVRKGRRFETENPLYFLLSPEKPPTSSPCEFEGMNMSDVPSSKDF